MIGKDEPTNALLINDLAVELLRMNSYLDAERGEK